MPQPVLLSKSSVLRACCVSVLAYAVCHAVCYDVCHAVWCVVWCVSCAYLHVCVPYGPHKCVTCHVLCVVCHAAISLRVYSTPFLNPLTLAFHRRPPLYKMVKAGDLHLGKGKRTNPQKASMSILLQVSVLVRRTPHCHYPLAAPSFAHCT